MCGALDAIGSFFQSPAGHIVTAVGAIAIAAITGNPFAIIAAVGATVSAIGSVTGNQTLNTVGSVIGAVGLVGGLANAAGLVDAADIFGTSNVFGGGAGIATAANDAGAGATAAETASPFASGATSGYSNVGDLMAGEGIGTSNTSVMDGITSQVIPPTGAVPTAEAPTVAPPAAVDTTVPGTTSGSTTATLASQGTPNVGPGTAGGGGTPSIDQEISQWSQYGAPTPPVTGTPASLNADGSLINPKDAGIPGSFNASQTAANAYGPATGPVTPTTPSAWDTISTWLEGHPTMALGALMSAGSFLSGATSPLTPAQVSALQAQALQNQAAANYADQQAKLANQNQALLQLQYNNMSQPLPVASRTPTPPVGMINQAPKLAPVTGQVSV